MMKSSTTLSRRSFFKRVTHICIGFGIVLAALVVGKFTLPSKKDRRTFQKVRVCDEEQVPILGVKSFEISYLQQQRKMTKRIFLVAQGLDTPPKAFSAICTHLGCQVEWKRDQEAFVCPCHQGIYSMDGIVLSGPPPTPLHELPLIVLPEGAFVDIQVG